MRYLLNIRLDLDIAPALIWHSHDNSIDATTSLVLPWGKDTNAIIRMLDLTHYTDSKAAPFYLQNEGLMEAIDRYGFTTGSVLKPMIRQEVGRQLYQAILNGRNGQKVLKLLDDAAGRADGEHWHPGIVGPGGGTGQRRYNSPT